MKTEDKIRNLITDCMNMQKEINHALNNKPYCQNAANGIKCPGVSNYCDKLRELSIEIKMVLPFAHKNLSIDIPLLTAVANGHACVNPYTFERIYVTLGFINNLYTIPKPSKIFISHSELDSAYVTKFVGLLEKLGIEDEQLFCSSVEGYHIPMSDNDENDLYTYLRGEFNNYNLYVIFMLSRNYYESTVCLNEMGAAWVLQSDYQSILLPNFVFPEIKGVVNPRKISFKLDDNRNRHYRLNELKDKIVDKLELAQITHSKWERQRDEFLDEIDKIEILG